MFFRRLFEKRVNDRYTRCIAEFALRASNSVCARLSVPANVQSEVHFGP
jgi:hypothetical protein